jgi:hypothetical protein
MKKLSLREIPLIKVIYLSIGLVILNSFFILVVQKNLPPEVPLFYGLSKGQEQLASPLGLLIPGGLSLIVIIINTSLAILLSNKFLQQTLVVSAFAITLFSIITTTKIIFLVGSFQ